MLRPMPCSCYSHRHPRIWPRMHKLFDQGLLFFLPHSNPCFQIWCLPSWSFFVDFASGLYDTTFWLTAFLIKHLILSILPLLLQACTVWFGLTPNQLWYSCMPQGDHTILNDPSFSFPTPHSHFCFPGANGSTTSWSCFLLPPLPLLISPPPLLSATLSLGHIFSLCYSTFSPSLLLLSLLLNFSALASQEPKSRLLASRPITLYCLWSLHHLWFNPAILVLACTLRFFSLSSGFAPLSALKGWQTS